ncbi:protein phosphatase 1 regulatory subunit 1B isoform X2 [Stegostoma tigrinum]|uniref:protein phosphatase 1 regulatory subunit 1B isoform X2 n=1 Tax=Stegostoma tigrinum TaxID=3053191 RepID=UPI0028707F9F|nr:protein phosphatase 1 regulatory subunit 1B isoform X2 [Stegostoma tigrinum]
MDPKNRKKISFSVPVKSSHLDTRAVEKIRRRRPTPATLFRLSDHSSPEEEPVSYQRSSFADSEILKSKRATPLSSYTPPSLKAVQCIVQSQFGAKSTHSQLDDTPSDMAECDSILSDSSDTDLLQIDQDPQTDRKAWPKSSRGTPAVGTAATGTEEERSQAKREDTH